MSAVDGLEQVGLLGLGRQTGRRPGSLDIDDDERQLERDGKAEHLLLEVEAGPRGGGHPERSAVARTERRADAGDLILRLEGPDAELLALRELVEDV